MKGQTLMLGELVSMYNKMYFCQFMFHNLPRMKS